ncbi:MAG: molybdopterin-dependent oxidoreductase, partial [Gammaproteobacteria bacterium]|nr:molybdopterin-dependent oxidoreductase [Gammaproteobacteria bacterium]
MSTIKNLNRREFIALTGRAGGAFIIGSSFTGAALASESPAKLNGDPSSAGNKLGLFVNIDSAGNVEIICHRMEMGQGILTSTPQIVAEELCADWSRVTAVLGNADPRLGNQSTGGSNSIRKHMAHTRQMGAVARDMLEQAAAQIWSVDKSEVKAERHSVIHTSSDRKLTFGELAARAASLPIPDPKTVSLKPKSEFTLIGKDVSLQGLEKIVVGEAVYAQDIQLPGMLIASIERPPVVGGKTKSFDASQALKVKGVVDVIQLKDRSFPVVVYPLSGVAVLATNTWAAIEGRKKLKVTWVDGENQTHNSERYKQD